MGKSRAEQVIELLWDSLKRDPAHKDRRWTGWGTKTQTGLVACIEQINAKDEAPDPKWTEDDWAQEVREGTTLRGFREWAQAKTEEEETPHRGRRPEEFCAKCGGSCQFDSDGNVRQVQN